MNCVWTVCGLCAIFILPHRAPIANSSSRNCYICNKQARSSEKRAKNKEGKWYHKSCFISDKRETGEYKPRPHNPPLVSSIPSSPPPLLPQNPAKKVNFQQELTKLIQMPDENIRKQKDYDELGPSL